MGGLAKRCSEFTVVLIPGWSESQVTFGGGTKTSNTTGPECGRFFPVWRQPSALPSACPPTEPPATSPAHSRKQQC
eukprot:431207-Pelagomonas_calceolata.AAC.1